MKHIQTLNSSDRHTGNKTAVRHRFDTLEENLIHLHQPHLSGKGLHLDGVKATSVNKLNVCVNVLGVEALVRCVFAQTGWSRFSTDPVNHHCLALNLITSGAAALLSVWFKS